MILLFSVNKIFICRYSNKSFLKFKSSSKKSSKNIFILKIGTQRTSQSSKNILFFHFERSEEPYNYLPKRPGDLVQMEKYFLLTLNPFSRIFIPSKSEVITIVKAIGYPFQNGLSMGPYSGVVVKAINQGFKPIFNPAF